MLPKRSAEAALAQQGEESCAWAYSPIAIISATLPPASTGPAFATSIFLTHHLKALKLPTFLSEYDKVARQCAEEGVDHTRYLLRLAELELIDRERRMVERRIKQARFPVQTNFSYWMTGKDAESLLAEVAVEVLRMDTGDRRRNRRNRHVWNIL